MWRTPLKLPFSLAIGALITLGLFGVMHLLINGGPGFAGVSGTNPAIRFGLIQIVPEVPPNRPNIPPKPEPPKQLPTPRKPAPAEIDPPETSATPEFPGLDLPTGKQGQLWTSGCQHYPVNCAEQGEDGDVVALATIQPMYPRRAAQMGEEGYVTVEFTITATGVVINASVIDAKPRRVFEQAALRAIVKWKFRPRFVNGQAVARRATQTLEFRLT